MDNFVNTAIGDQTALYYASQSEKRAVRRAAWAVTVPGIVFFIVNIFLGEIIFLTAKRFGVTPQEIKEFLSDPAILQILSVILSITLLTVPFIICAKIMGEKISSLVPLTGPESDNNFAFFLFGVGFCAFANIAVSAAGRIFQSFGIDYSVSQPEDPEGIFGFLLVIISTAVVPALVEEFAYRGIVLGLLKPFGEAFAIFGSAAAFGLLHGNFEQIPFAFLVGLVLGFVRVKTGSILICMAIHATNNLIAVLSSYSSALPTAAVNLAYTLYIVAALTLAVLGVAFLKQKNSFELATANTVNPTKRIYTDFFFSPAFIIFTLLFLFKAVLYMFM